MQIPSRLLVFLIFLIGFARPGQGQQAQEELIIKFNLPPNESLAKTNETIQLRLNELRSALGDFVETGLMESMKSDVIRPFYGVRVLRLAGIRLTPVLVDSLAGLPGVEYVSRNHVFRIDQSNDDPLRESQWGLERVRIAQAWSITQGSPDIPVAIIDTGLDVGHEDLSGQVWVNPGEDLNQNGLADQSDYDGEDSDGNGLVDDLLGWDFVDTRRYPDSGDHLIPDNDPTDENGHGTSMSGIIAAIRDNNLGVAGIAPNSRIAVLRAGTKQGLLEEDDVASAILYAVAMGFRIINMSFGDKAITPLLSDVIRFAYKNDVIMIASSGNGGSDDIHFPSGLTETISIGATNISDLRASFSNYGSSLDVVAPGVGILTTLPDSKYGEVSGTSAAAPFVSGSVALMLSLQPELTPELVRERLLKSVDDIGDSGWDFEYGAGRLRSDRLVSGLGPGEVRILSPRHGLVTGSSGIPVIATCAGAALSGFELEIGIGPNPELWENLLTSDQLVISETLTVWSPPDLDTVYTFRMAGLSRGVVRVEDYVSIEIDRSAPVISNFRLDSVITGRRAGYLLSFETDDVSEARLFFRPAGSGEEFQSRKLFGRSRIHSTLISDSLGAIDYFMEVNNLGDMKATYPGNPGWDQLNFDASPIFESFEPLSIGVSPGFLGRNIADFDHDGNPEIIMNEYDEQSDYGNLVYWEFGSDQFGLAASVPLRVIPRDVADVNGDEQPDLLAGAGPTSMILSGSAGNLFPSQIVWLDTNDVWGGRFYDFQADGFPEMIARVGDEWKLWHNEHNFSFSIGPGMQNLSDGENGVGVPHVEIGNFDIDEETELLFGDFDGDIYIYEISQFLQPTWEWSTRLPLIDAIDFIASGDFDGDGQIEFAAASHSESEIDLEHQFDNRHWLIQVFDSDAQDSYSIQFQQRFHPYHEPARFESSLSSGDIDGDGRAELLASFYPNLYVIEYDESSSDYQVVSTHAPVQTNHIIVHDFSGSGQNQLLLGTGKATSLFQFAGPVQVVPDYPSNLDATPIDAQSVELTWNVAESGPPYRVYRGTQPDSIDFLSVTNVVSFSDSGLSENLRFYYRVSSFSDGTEGFSNISSAQPHLPANWEISRVMSPNQLVLRFSVPMGGSVSNPENYLVKETGSVPQSAALSQNLRDLLLTWKDPFDLPFEATLVVANLKDSSSMAIDQSATEQEFTVSEEGPKAPYLIRANFVETHKLRLDFSQPMVRMSLLDQSNYRLEPGVDIMAVGIVGGNDQSVVLDLDPSRTIGPSGYDYDLYIDNLMGLSGLPLNTVLSRRVTFSFVAADLSRVYVYPNPAREVLTFARLTPEVTIEIYNQSGVQVATIEGTAPKGGITWNLMDREGMALPSGVYLYRIYNETETHWGKFAVVR